MNVKAMLTNGFARNVGTIDRIVRALFALSVPVLYVTGVIGGITAAILGVLAVLILRTSVTGKCGIYYGLGLSTQRTPPDQSPISGERRR